MKIIIKKLFSTLAYLSNKVFYKKSGIIFSQANSRFSGNSKYLFLYLAENNYNVKWLYSDNVQKCKVPIVYHNLLVKRRSLKGLIYILQSKYFVISYGKSDFGLYWYFCKYNVVINLWHGICIKKIGLADVKFKSIGDDYKNTETKYYDYMIVSSEIDMYVTSASHFVDIRNVLVTGNPRTDNYVKNINNMTTKNLHKNILYAPTFRDYEIEGSTFFPFKDFDTKKMGDFIKNNEGIVFYMRPHPSDINSINMVNNLQSMYPKNIKNYSVDICDDIDEVLNMFDLIITDYSSIYIEPLLNNTPCIFIPFDLDKYKKTRGLAYNYDEITPGDKVNTFENLLLSIAENINNPRKYQTDRERVKNMFFRYDDSDSCKRICEIIFD